jgi:hypothetical protein
MRTECQISMGVIQGRTVPCQHPRLTASSPLRLPTDSKALSRFLSSQSLQRSFPDSPFTGIGQERAFTEAPPDIKVLPPKAARRES